MIQTAVIAKRVDSGDPDTTEISRLAEAAGATPVDTVTQVRPADTGRQFGRGKVEQLTERVRDADAEGVIVDNELTPRQLTTLEDAIGVRVIDRHRLVLEIFAEQARTKRAQLQVELARLRYELPRIEATGDPKGLNIMLETGTWLHEVRDRIDKLEARLEALSDPEAVHRASRSSFDRVAIAGYTNAGKSTILRRLADDLSLEAEVHPDLRVSAAVEDRLFKTLETTTRRATIDGRTMMLTDTVGFLDDLPHWLVESFRGTLDEIRTADAVLLVADLSRSVEELERTLRTADDSIPADRPIVTVLNKADTVVRESIERRLDAVADITPNPVVCSARHDPKLTTLKERLIEALPELAERRLELPLTDASMSLISWLHDEAATVETSYGSETVEVHLTAKSSIIDRANARAESI